VVGEYVDIKQNYDGIELHSFGYPDEAEAVKATVARLPDMVKFYSELTGVKYPYPSYSQTFVQDSPGWMEGITASTITENMVDDETTHADWFYLWDLTESETLAHQWFGNYLTCRDWSQIWLNKSFAHHLTGLPMASFTTFK
jgi:aminopeptidase N